MSLKCLFGHKWNDDKCEKCGKIRGKDMRITIEVERMAMFIGGTVLHLYLNGKNVGKMKPSDMKTTIYSKVENNSFHAYIPEKNFHGASFSFKVPKGSHVRLNIMAGVVMSMDTLDD